MPDSHSKYEDLTTAEKDFLWGLSDVVRLAVGDSARHFKPGFWPLHYAFYPQTADLWLHDLIVGQRRYDFSPFRIAEYVTRTQAVVPPITDEKVPNPTVWVMPCADQEHVPFWRALELCAEFLPPPFDHVSRIILEDEVVVQPIVRLFKSWGVERMPASLSGKHFAELRRLTVEVASNAAESSPDWIDVWPLAEATLVRPVAMNPHVSLAQILECFAGFPDYAWEFGESEAEPVARYPLVPLDRYIIQDWKSWLDTPRKPFPGLCGPGRSYEQERDRLLVLLAEGSKIDWSSYGDAFVANGYYSADLLAQVRRTDRSVVALEHFDEISRAGLWVDGFDLAIAEEGEKCGELVPKSAEALLSADVFAPEDILGPDLKRSVRRADRAYLTQVAVLCAHVVEPNRLLDLLSRTWSRRQRSTHDDNGPESDIQEVLESCVRDALQIVAEQDMERDITEVSIALAELGAQTGSQTQASCAHLIDQALSNLEELGVAPSDLSATLRERLAHVQAWRDAVREIENVVTTSQTREAQAVELQSRLDAAARDLEMVRCERDQYAGHRVILEDPRVLAYCCLSHLELALTDLLEQSIRDGRVPHEITVHTPSKRNAPSEEKKVPLHPGADTWILVEALSKYRSKLFAGIDTRFVEGIYHAICKENLRKRIAHPGRVRPSDLLDFAQDVDAFLLAVGKRPTGVPELAKRLLVQAPPVSRSEKNEVGSC